MGSSVRTVRWIWSGQIRSGSSRRWGVVAGVVAGAVRMGASVSARHVQQRIAHLSPATLLMIGGGQVACRAGRIKLQEQPVELEFNSQAHVRALPDGEKDAQPLPQAPCLALRQGHLNLAPAFVGLQQSRSDLSDEIP